MTCRLLGDSPNHLSRLVEPCAWLVAVVDRLLVAVVVLLAQRLPVRLVPEQGLIASMRNPVIDDLGGVCSAVRFAHLAELVQRQEMIAGFPPARVIAALG